MADEIEKRLAKLDVVEPVNDTNPDEASEDEAEIVEEELRNNHKLGLKEGLDLRELLDLKPVTIELDQPPNEFESEEYTHFSGSEVLKYLNPQCIGMEETSSDTEDETDLTPFEKMAKTMEKLTDDGRILKKIVTHGQGFKIPDGAQVTVHYNAYVEYGDEPFDCTRLRGHPMKSRLGQGNLLPGLEIAIKSMKKDEVASFLVKPEYAYGSMGCPPRIPAGATVLFEVELIDFIDHAAILEVENMTEEERREGRHFHKILAACKAEHRCGNNFFRERNYGKAISRYSRAINLLEKCNLRDETEDAEHEKLLQRLYLNMALCRIRTNRPVPAMTQCNKVLDVDPKNVKALYLKGKSKGMLSEYRPARDFLRRALELKPQNQEIIQLLEELDNRELADREHEKLLLKRMVLGPRQATASSKPDTGMGNNSEVLEEFRALADKRMQEFCQNPDIVEIPFPSTLSDPEFRCLQEVIKKYPLQIKEILVENQKKIRIAKISSEE